MKVFAMDTSTLTATVAVVDDNKLLGEYTVSDKLTHSQTIMPMSDALLSSLDMKLDDIDIFSVCIGPGSFTGIRIGMATVKTFAQVFSKPIIGVSSLDALAYNFFGTDDAVICPLIDCRRGEVYNALYTDGQKICPDRTLHFDDVAKELSNKKVIFCGDGAIANKDKIINANNPLWKTAPEHLILPRASSVAFCAKKRAESSDYDDAFTLNPLYLRKSQAERELEEKTNQMEEYKNDSYRL